MSNVQVTASLVLAPLHWRRTGHRARVETVARRRTNRPRQVMATAAQRELDGVFGDLDPAELVLQECRADCERESRSAGEAASSFSTRSWSLICCGPSRPRTEKLLRSCFAFSQASVSVFRPLTELEVVMRPEQPGVGLKPILAVASPGMEPKQVLVRTDERSRPTGVQALFDKSSTYLASRLPSGAVLFEPATVMSDRARLSYERAVAALNAGNFITADETFLAERGVTDDTVRQLAEQRAVQP